MTFFRRMDNAQYRSFLLHNVTIDFCSAMGGKWDPIIGVFGKELRKYSNFYQACPRRGHIYWKPHFVDTSSYPPILPGGIYYTKMIMYSKSENTDHMFLQLIMHFEIIPMGTERF